MINLLIQFTENDKRLLIIILFAFILLFVIAGYIGLLISRVLKYTGKKLDTMMHDIVITRVVKTKKEFIKVARKKNWRYFYKTAWIPLLILISSFAILIMAYAFNDWNFNLFDFEKQGFNTLFFVWDFDNPDIYVKVFGMTVLAEWPPLINSPHFEVEALWSYFFIPVFLVGLIWYLGCLQALLGRTLRMYKLADSIYQKSLENINMSTLDMMGQNPMNMNNPYMNNMGQNNINNAPQNNINNQVNNQNNSNDK